MDSLLPKVKTVRVMLKDFSQQQDAIFRMAFKMHNTTNYEIVEQSAEQKPDMILVDVDGQRGMLPWHEAKQQYSGIPVVIFSSNKPMLTAPYLAKPVKFDTLFPTLRSLAQGGSIYVAQSEEKDTQATSERVQEEPRKATIKRFNPQSGLLGALKMASTRQQDIAVLHNSKPVLIVFPSIQRVLLTVSAEELERMCQNDNLEIVCKAVPDNPQWKEKAKVTIMSCMWQMAIWTAQGRLVYPLTPQTVFTLKRWPNLTRLAPVPESMRLSAFLTKTSVNLNVLYKVMPLDMADILNYLAATYVTGFLATDEEFVTSRNAAQKSDQNTAPEVEASMSVNSNDVTDKKMSNEAERVASGSKEQPRGLLNRLMRKLIGK